MSQPDLKIETPAPFRWSTDAFDIDFVLDAKNVVAIRRIVPKGKHLEQGATPIPSSDVPLINVKLVGEGNTSNKTAKSLIGSYLSARMRYKSHETHIEGSEQTLVIETADDLTKVHISVRLVVYGNIPVLRSSATITNQSDDATICVTQLSSLSVGNLVPVRDWHKEYTLHTATNSWFREAQWSSHTLPELGIDLNGICELPDGHTGSQASFSLQSLGSFSTGTHLPMGILKSKHDTDTWLWQVEHNGSWRWEVGDYKDNLYLVAGGPVGVAHDWKLVLDPKQSFTTAKVAVARVFGGMEDAFAAITSYRRRIRRRHTDSDRLPIVFNDYMNCLMGDPDEEKIKALIDPVVKSGAEYFVIDAGWYADDSNWWDDVGLWEPSLKRFPSGFKALLDEIRSKGLIPGVWLEPEVVGVRSVVGQRLPREAFFHENGQRIVEKGRFQLDYRCEQVRTWMDQVVHRLVVDNGVGFFKFDYNIEVLQGTDVHGPSSAGVAHLEHQRAYLSWVESLFDRYPDLVIESCSSGAQRLDYAMLSVHPLQSTSDQQDPSLYAAIAAAMPAAVTPEQSASWAYPQPEWSDEINALTVINSLMGRVYLSGRLDKLSEEQLQLVIDGMNVYKSIRQDLRDSQATWPLGLPGWHDEWLALGLVATSGSIYLAVWRRGGPTEMQIPIHQQSVSEKDGRVEVLYPKKMSTGVTLKKGVLKVELPDVVCARLFLISN
ncbi:unnamed protein product [Clonostachys solani]|uniref:alpha-galactosidase n=1 Tax=Clonostachys solani TaxID=160281 RepID=A0A9P0ELQ6_9HYPO|nr:unnamed protein product [Clonostachys solani]